jgi:hypothetical protein
VGNPVTALPVGGLEALRAQLPGCQPHLTAFADSER